MKRTIFTLILLFLVIGVQNVTAEEPGLHKGDLELSGRLSFNHSRLSVEGGSDVTSSNLEFGSFFGVFLSDLIQIGGTLFVDYNSWETSGHGSVSHTSFGIGPDIVFNFNNKGPLVPYIDFALAVAIYSGDSYGEEIGFILPSIQGGLRVLIGDSAAANFGVGYAHVSNVSGYDGRNKNAFSVFAGFSVFP